MFNQRGNLQMIAQGVPFLNIKIMPISAVGNIIGTAIQGATNYATAKMNNQEALKREKLARLENFTYGEKAANAADARTRALYGDLYSPQAQMQQIKDAGLSPAIFGGNGQGISGKGGVSGAQGNGASGVSPQVFGMSPIDIAQIGLIQAQTEKTDAETSEIKGETTPMQVTMKEQIAKTQEALANAGFLQTSEEFKKQETEWQKITNSFLPTEKTLNIEKLSLELKNITWQTEQVKWAAKREHLNWEFDVKLFDTRETQLKADLTKTLNEATLALARTNESIKNIEFMDFNMEATAQQILQGWKKLEIEDAGQKAQERFYMRMGRAALMNADTNARRLETEKGWKEQEFSLTRRQQNLNLMTNLVQAWVSKTNAFMSLAGDVVSAISPFSALGGAASSAVKVAGFK